MSNNKIEFPHPPVYYIVKRVLNQTIPTAYDFLKSDQVLATDAEHVQQFESFTNWQTELATYGITVDLDSDGIWYNVE